MGTDPKEPEAPRMNMAPKPSGPLYVAGLVVTDREEAIRDNIGPDGKILVRNPECGCSLAFDVGSFPGRDFRCLCKNPRHYLVMYKR